MKLIPKWLKEIFSPEPITIGSCWKIPSENPWKPKLYIVKETKPGWVWVSVIDENTKEYGDDFHITENWFRKVFVKQ